MSCRLNSQTEIVLTEQHQNRRTLSSLKILKSRTSLIIRMSLVPLKASGFSTSVAKIVSRGAVDTKSTINQVRRYSRAINFLLADGVVLFV